MKGLIFLTVPLAILLIVVSYNPNILIGLEQAGHSQNADSSPLSVLSIIGGIFVFIFYKMKFSRWPGPDSSPAGFRPHPTRHFTTWLRYTCWSIVYASSMTALFYIIILFPQAILYFVQIMSLEILNGVTGADFNILRKLFAQIIDNSNINDPNVMVPVAVITVTFVWAGAFAKYERRFRQTIQEAALIPNEAQRLIRVLEDSADAFMPDDETKEEIIRQSSKKGFILHDSDFLPGDDNAIFRYVQSLYIDSKIRNLEKDPDFAKIIARYEADITEHKNYLEKLTERWVNYKKALVELITYIIYRGRKSSLDAAQAEISNSSTFGKIERVKSKFENRIPPFLNELITSIIYRNRKSDLDLDQVEELNSLTLGKIEGVKSRIEKRIPSFLNEQFDEEIKYLQRSSAQCLRNLLQIIVCGVLALGKTPIKRRKFLEKVSYFASGEIGPSFNRNYVAKIVIALSTIVFLGTLVLYLMNYFLEIRPGSPDIVMEKLVPAGAGTIGLWTTYSLMMHLLGIFSGFVLEKAHMPQQDEQDNNIGFPYADVAECFIFGFSLNVIFLVLMNFPFHDWHNWQEIQANWAWAFVPAITAGFTGYYVSDRCKINKKIFLSLIQGAFTSLTSVLIILTIYFDKIVTDLPKELITFSIYCIVLTFGIGFVLAHILQSWIYSK